MEFVILSLLVWRFSSLLVFEEGPAFIFARLRYAVGIRYFNAEENEELSFSDHKTIWLGEFPLPYVQKEKNDLSKVFSCLWCMSIWVAFLVSVLFGLELARYSLSLSAGAIVVEALVRRLE